MKNVVALIPARGGSKGVPRKNVVTFDGRPLIYYAVQQAVGVPTINSVWVSTEDTMIKETVSYFFGNSVNILDRPIELAGDFVSTELVMEHFRNKVDFDILVLIQCTSPCVRSEDIKNGIDLVISDDYDSALSLTTMHQFIWFDGLRGVYPITYRLSERKRRQEEQSRYYKETGAFYITTKEQFRLTGQRVGGRIGKVLVPFWSSFEIDTLDDLAAIELLYRGEVTK